MVVELMGRHSGWIAVTAGMAGGADIILAPEEPFDIETIAKKISTATGTRTSPSSRSPKARFPRRARNWTGSPTIDEKGNPIAGSIGHEVTKAIEAHDRLPDAAHGARLRPARGHSRRLRTGCSARVSASPRSTLSSPARPGNTPRSKARDIVLKDFSAMMGKTKWVPEGIARRRRGVCNGRLTTASIRLCACYAQG